MNNRRERFDRAYNTYGQTLFRICVTHIGHADAEDVMQEAFIRYLRRDRPFQDDEHERRWLIRVCVNLCRSRHRARRPGGELRPDSVAAPDAYGERELLDAVRRLPPKLKSVVILHCCEGCTLEETAKLLKIGLSAAKMRLLRAREKLKLDLDM
ncbi:MAG: RNA polymerase sigma factor [Oscillospiraceae bacterium]|nr:RNA polymerase sigma factor [Oscillospiraceae bacterium]